MECPRCGGRLTVYRLGGESSWVCNDCGSVGVEAEHGSEPEPTESWEEALQRFYTRHGDDQSTDSRDEPPPTGAAELLDTLEIPGEEKLRAQRRETVAELYAYLRKQGDATRKEFLELVDPETVGYASAEGFWEAVGRDSLRELPGVESPDPGHHQWRFDANEEGPSE